MDIALICCVALKDMMYHIQFSFDRNNEETTVICTICIVYKVGRANLDLRLLLYNFYGDLKSHINAKGIVYRLVENSITCIFICVCNAIHFMVENLL